MKFTLTYEALVLAARRVCSVGVNCATKARPLQFGVELQTNAGAVSDSQVVAIIDSAECIEHLCPRNDVFDDPLGRNLVVRHDIDRQFLLRKEWPNIGVSRENGLVEGAFFFKLPDKPSLEMQGRSAPEVPNGDCDFKILSGLRRASRIDARSNPWTLISPHCVQLALNGPELEPAHENNGPGQNCNPDCGGGGPSRRAILRRLLCDVWSDVREICVLFSR